MQNLIVKKLRIHQATLVIGLLFELTIVSSAAEAANITVDGTVCILADAITAANFDLATGGCTPGLGSDQLILTPGGVYLLTFPLPDIVSDVTILGNQSTIVRDPLAPGFRIFSVNGTAANLNIIEVTISGGYQDNNLGSGISVFDGNVQINRCNINNNVGGGVFISNSQNSTVEGSVIESNVGLAADAGGFDNDNGAGLSISDSSVTITNSRIFDNDNDAILGSGGGLFVTNGAGSSNIFISNTTLANNNADQGGGGLSMQGSGNSIIINIQQSTISGNSSNQGGGGVSINDGFLVMVNTTLSNNHAAVDGGGMEVMGGTIDMIQTLVSGNSSGGFAPEINAPGGLFNLNSSNLFGHSGNSGVVGIPVGGTDIVPTVTFNNILAPLADNGGGIYVHELVLGGPAIDEVLAIDCASGTDQLGRPKPFDGDFDGVADCDIGAVESVTPDLIFASDFE